MSYNDELLKMVKARKVIKSYALSAATVSFITAIDPEPLSGTALVIFADTPIVTGITLTMIGHLAIIYDQRNLVKDGMICAVATSTGMVLGALGAKVLGRLIPLAGTVNNAVITYSLHYATGRAIIDFFSSGYTIKDLKAEKIKEMAEQYRNEGESEGRRAAEIYRSMSKTDKKELNRLTKEMKKTNKHASKALKNNVMNQYSRYQSELDRIFKGIDNIYGKYGWSAV